MAANRDDLARVSGPESMAKPEAPSGPSTGDVSPNTQPAGSSSRPNDTLRSMPSTSGDGSAPKKKRHRGGRNRRKTRRQSFIAPSEATEEAVEVEERPSLLDVPNPRSATNQASLYRLQSGGNRSNTSLESEALLDHRDTAPHRSRRKSISQTFQQGFARASLATFQRGHRSSGASMQQGSSGRSRLPRGQGNAISEDDEEDANERTGLLSQNNRSRPDISRAASGQNYGSSHTSHGGLRQRRSSGHSKASTRRRVQLQPRHDDRDDSSDYDVNNPPSMPGSPQVGSLDDIMVGDAHFGSDRGRDAVIDIDDDENLPSGRRYSSASPDEMRRRPTVAELAERDVCFPGDAGLSEIGEEEDHHSQTRSTRAKRRRARGWPDLEILEEWSREEKEERTQQEQIRAKKISEPVLVGGRLRPGKAAWHREEDDSPFRFTYFNEFLDGTIHARTISDLCQDGSTFRDLFLPDPVELSDDSEDDEEDNRLERSNTNGANGRLTSGHKNQQPSTQSEAGSKRSPSVSNSVSKSNTGSNTPSGPRSQAPTPKPHAKSAGKRYGPRPTFWLDVLSPTEVEMKVLSKAFGIHQLTTEDILMEEPREKVELFQSYYFVNYRSFEQDRDNEDYMEPINMYVVVFRDGVITFHHSMTPHPANVRRRIRQLNDYMSPTADWISYAIIDDITDVYAPLVQQIEEQVDYFDDEILYMHQTSADKLASEQRQREKERKNDEKQGIASNASNQGDMGAAKTEAEKTAGESGGDMLRRVGECRKKVMGLYRLLGNKADVIKGFAKRCNEHWEVAPRSEIGLYLGDIQDHIVTMTGNLSHYEK